MKLPEVLYNKVYASLMKYYRQFRSLEQNIEDVEKAYKKGCESVDDSVQKLLNDNTNTLKRLEACIEIAKAHATHLVKAEQEFPIDIRALSQLSVQINSGSKNDIFAEQLYTQATGQLATCIRSLSDIQEKNREKKRKLFDSALVTKGKLQKSKEKLNSEILSYLQSDEFEEFVTTVYNYFSMFDGHGSINYILEKSCFIGIGTKLVKLPIPSEFTALVVEKSYSLYDQSNSQIGIPVCIDFSRGSGIIIDYTNETEELLLNGVQNFLFNIAAYCENIFEQIVFIDPVRFNNSSLGILQPFATGGGSFIDNVPLSLEEVKSKLASIIENLNADERKLLEQEKIAMPKRLLILHNFPQLYDSQMISQIRQIFVNAQHYNITIIVTHNLSSKSTLMSDSLTYMYSKAEKRIGCSNNGFLISNLSNCNVPFRWYSAPKKMSEDIYRKYVTEKHTVDTSNNYEHRLGFDVSKGYSKGVRELTDIPYGIDEQGNIQTLDFENSNFATFICGASRAGKSNLLHTLITGIIKNNHPDDVEIWLIDFKMTEFSHYITHLPPHVRYIILDESPELVYDIINRLSEILIKRQNAFKGKWLKLGEVPSEKYMPAIIVIIDEFSVMSQIIADSITNSKENYSGKLQTLLAKGSALGLHFIFASQDFTSGTRGLTPFSKKQIQQRIVMKTEYNEIKETLDLKSASDDDKAMMEQLPVYHALVRIPMDEKGNHLKLTNVLYISDRTKQEKMIDTICKMVNPAPRYNVNDPSTYIDKKPMIIDGNNYSTFVSEKNNMNAYLQKYLNVLCGEGEVVLFLGEPRRMMPLYPIEIVNGFCENILVLAPSNEKMPATSILMSIAASLEMQGKGIEIWTTRKNAVYRQLVIESKQSFQTLSSDLDEVCNSIRSTKELIQSKVDGDRFVVLLGFESLLMDMIYQEDVGESRTAIGSSITKKGVSIEKRAPGEMDLNSLLDSLINGDSFQEKTVTVSNIDKDASIDIKDESIGAYDARNDLKFILTRGPRLGYHFIMVYNSVGELEQSKLDLNLFRHKILFRFAKAEVANVIGSVEASIVSELDNHSFRYTNGLDALTFRPYLHPGLIWDGWQMSDNLAVNVVNEEDEYLM